jgi:hypothetical protein
MFSPWVILNYHLIILIAPARVTELLQQAQMQHAGAPHGLLPLEPGGVLGMAVAAINRREPVDCDGCHPIRYSAGRAD